MDVALVVPLRRELVFSTVSSLRLWAEPHETMADSYKKLSNEEIEACRVAFSLFDKDQSGTIDMSELKTTLTSEEHSTRPSPPTARTHARHESNLPLARAPLLTPPYLSPSPRALVSTPACLTLCLRAHLRRNGAESDR